MSETENSTKTEKPAKQPLPLWRRILLGLILIMFLTLSGFMLTSYWMGRNLGREIVKIHQAGEPLTLTDLHRETSPESVSDDAASIYDQGLMMIGSADLQQITNFNNVFRMQILTTPPNKLPQQLRDKAAEYSVALKPILEQLDHACKLDTCHYDLGLSQGIKIFSDRLARAHICSLVLSTRTMEMITQGQGDEAARSAISMLKLTRVLDDQAIINTLPIRLMSAKLATEDARLIVERTNPSKASLVRLQQALADVHPDDLLVKMLLAERADQINIAQNLVPDKIVEEYLQGNPQDWPGRITPGNAYSRLRVRRNSTKYLQDMANMIAAARGTWPGLIDDIEAVKPKKKKAENKGGMTATEIANKIGEALARARATTCLVAVARYQRDNGQLPASLEDLVPNYIDAIPQDPFTGAKILYKHDEASYMIYSAGRNRNDDNGVIVRTSAREAAPDLGLLVRFGPAKPRIETKPPVNDQSVIDTQPKN